MRRLLRPAAAMPHVRRPAPVRFPRPATQDRGAGRPLAADVLGPHPHRPGAGAGTLFRPATPAPGPARSAEQPGPGQLDLDRRVRVGVFADPASPHLDGRRHVGRRRPAARRPARRPGRRLERRAVGAAGPALAPEFRADHHHADAGRRAAAPRRVRDVRRLDRPLDLAAGAVGRAGPPGAAAQGGRGATAGAAVPAAWPGSGCCSAPSWPRPAT